LTVTKAVTVLPLLLVVLVGPVHAGPPEAPGRDFGKARVEIPVPSKWVMVRGWKGGTPVTEGFVTFYDENEVVIRWKADWAGSSWWTGHRRDYRLDPNSGLPVIGGLSPVPSSRLVERGTFRLVSGGLEFQLVGTDWTDFKGPTGDLWLILKPAER
jgi:hypothetical protein